MNSDDHDHNDGAPHHTVSPSATGTRRRRRWVAGVAGMAAVLGAGAYLATDRIVTTDQTEARDSVAAPIGIPTTAGSPGEPAPAGPATQPTAGAAAALPEETRTPDPRVSSEIEAARKKAAEDGVPVMRPRTSKPRLTAKDVTVKDNGATGTDERLKVVSAHGDLTDYEEMAWLPDDPDPTGTTDCTHRFQLSSDMAPIERPTLLICWRVSADKSVYTMAINPTGKPSKKASVKAIEKAWAAL
ncbi:MAG TPA: hypothetical protein VN408_06235 [Actinoplanes sp.]|nr:hypothetical protein [Actinoplanes sp.]